MPLGQLSKLIGAIEAIIIRAITGLAAAFDERSDSNFQKGLPIPSLAISEHSIGNVIDLIPATAILAKGPVVAHTEFRGETHTTFWPL
jgi:hypothetical protein